MAKTTKRKTTKSNKPTTHIMTAEELFNVPDDGNNQTDKDIQDMAKREHVEGRNFQAIKVSTDFYRKILRDNNIDDQRAKRYLKKYSTRPFFMTSEENVGKNGI